MSDSKLRILVYDKSDTDSLVCASILKYYLINNTSDPISEDLIKAYDWKDQPINLNMLASVIATEVQSISLCAAIVNKDLLRLMYQALGSQLLSVQFSPLYNNRVTNYTVDSSRLYTLISPRNDLANASIYNLAQSASLTLFQYLYGDDAEVPEFIKYLDAFVTDRYYDYELDRDEVIAFDKVLGTEVKADFDKMYEIVSKVLEGSFDMESILGYAEDAVEELTDDLLLLIEKYADDNYTINQNRTGILIETPERLTSGVLAQESGLEESYDNIITIWRMRPGYWKVCIYNLYHPTDDVVVTEDNLISMADRILIEKNAFIVGDYMYKQYNGYGNDLYGVGELTDTALSSLLQYKTFK